MMEDEGTLIAVREYISNIQQKHGLHHTAQDLAHFVIKDWKELSDSNHDQDITEIEALMDLNDDPSKWTVAARSAVNWLYHLGYDWKEVKNGWFKD